MENNNNLQQMDAKARESRGWEIARSLNDSMEEFGSVKCRQMMAEYFSLNCHKPSVLHSFILKLAAKMAVMFPDFHFVAFFKIWGYANIREEDKQRQSDSKGHSFPSTLETVAKAYAFSLLYHPTEELSVEEELQLTPILEAKGYKPVIQMVATKIFEADVKGRKMRFVKLIAADGTEASCEIHALTNHQLLRFADIPGMMFDCLSLSPVLQPLSPLSPVGKEPPTERPLSLEVERGRIVGAMVSQKRLQEVFPTCVGYIEHIDVQHRHVHIYDRYSRHMVAEAPRVHCEVGQFVEFFPVVPKGDKFKSAIINRILPQQSGPDAFGLREAKITYTDSEKGYCAWELTSPDNTPRTKGDEPLTNKGYINLQTAQALGVDLPRPGDLVKFIVFMKRGKDMIKRPHVVWFCIE